MNLIKFEFKSKQEIGAFLGLIYSHPEFTLENSSGNYSLFNRFQDETTTTLHPLYIKLPVGKKQGISEYESFSAMKVGIFYSLRNNSYCFYISS